MTFVGTAANRAGGEFAVQLTIPAVVPGDANADGGVNVTDLGILSNHYGQIGAAGATGASVPEPMTLAVLGLGGLLALRRRNRK